MNIANPGIEFAKLQLNRPEFAKSSKPLEAQSKPDASLKEAPTSPDSTSAQRRSREDDGDDLEYAPSRSSKRRWLSTKNSNMSVDKLRPGPRLDPARVDRCSPEDRKSSSRANIGGRTRRMLKNNPPVISHNTIGETIDISSSSSLSTSLSSVGPDSPTLPEEEQSWETCSDIDLDDVSKEDHGSIERSGKDGGRPIVNPRRDTISRIGAGQKPHGQSHEAAENTQQRSQDRKRLDNTPTGQVQNPNSLQIVKTHQNLAHDPSCNQPVTEDRASSTAETSLDRERGHLRPSVAYDSDERRARNTTTVKADTRDVPCRQTPMNLDAIQDQPQPHQPPKSPRPAKHDQRLPESSRNLELATEESQKIQGHKSSESQEAEADGDSSISPQMNPQDSMPKDGQPRTDDGASERAREANQGTLPENGTAEPASEANFQASPTATPQSREMQNPDASRDQSPRPASAAFGHTPHEEAKVPMPKAPDSGAPGLPVQRPTSDSDGNAGASAANPREQSRDQSFASPTPTPTPTAAAARRIPEKGQPGSTPGVQISYFVVASQGPRLVRIRWPQGSFRGRTLTEVFAATGRLVSRENIDRIDFQLTSSRIELHYPIANDDLEMYEEMKKDFQDTISSEVRKGHFGFKILLEPDPAEEQPETQIEGPIGDCAYI